MPDRQKPVNPDGHDGQDGAEGAADEAALAIVARHALHDEELVAALAAGALEGDGDADENARARGFVDRCPACRAVHDDVAAIVGATRAEASFTITAPRDFRLTVEDAQRLGGTVITRSPLGRLGRALAGFGRPVGASVAALGLVGVLVGGAMLGSLGASGTMSGTTDTGATKGGAGGTAAQGASAAPAATAAPVAAPASFEVAANPGPTAQASERTTFDTPAGGPRDAAGAGDPVALLLLASVLLVIIGLGLFAYATMAGRRGGSRPNAP